MDPVFKDYVDSKLESAEARNAASMAEFKGLVSAALARMDERDKAAESRQVEMQKQFDAFHAESRTTRKVVIATGITATLTILFGTAAINAAIIQSFHNAFDIGQRYSNLQNDISLQSQKTTATLKLMDERLASIERSIAPAKR